MWLVLLASLLWGSPLITGLSGIYVGLWESELWFLHFAARALSPLTYLPSLLLIYFFLNKI